MSQSDLRMILPSMVRRERSRANRLSLTLSVYIAKHALIGIVIALLALGLIAVVVDLIELLRRAGSRPR